MAYYLKCMHCSNRYQNLELIDCPNCNQRLARLWEDDEVEKEAVKEEVAFKEEVKTETSDVSWYYESNGDRVGPVPSQTIIQLIEEGTLDTTSLVWGRGQKDWLPIAATAFATHTAPPPLTGNSVSNTVVWWLAFTPVIGTIIQYIISNNTGADVTTLWWITWILNVFLCYLDDHNLKKAGHNTDKKLSGWMTILIPIYLFRRAKLLRQIPMYAIIWCVTYLVLTFSPSFVPDTFGMSNSTVVQSVKDGYLQNYSNETLGAAVNSFITDAKWKSIKADDGYTYVNISGTILYDGKDSNVLLQYRVLDSNNSFIFHALEINGVPQSVLVYSALLDKMYAAAPNS